MYGEPFKTAQKTTPDGSYVQSKKVGGKLAPVGSLNPVFNKHPCGLGRQAYKF